MNANAAKPTNVSAYLAGFPPPVKRVLTLLRNTMRKALPGSEEAISYGIPTYKLHGRVVIYFAGWKQHHSIYPATAGLVSAFRKELASYEVNDKGTIRFPLDLPVPVELIGRLAKYRATEVASRADARPAGRLGARARTSRTGARQIR
jgi:uncharacterized protein YdhG (YjbR/CyaY superfamily)